jgi:hypothetical protein
VVKPTIATQPCFVLMWCLLVSFQEPLCFPNWLSWFKGGKGRVRLSEAIAILCGDEVQSLLYKNFF